MKKLFITFILAFLCLQAFPQIDKQFYFQQELTFDQNIPFPGQVSGHAFGEWHFSHDQLVAYYKELAAQSPNVLLMQYGKTHENRPLYLLAVSSEENLARQDEIRELHLANIFREEEVQKELPLIIWLGYGVHGNESSPGNAAMLVSYYMAGAQSEEVENILNKSVILIDPCLNPDGFNRAASWSNMHMHQTVVTDPANRQFNEDWPGGRTNHYWFDLNRDWLPAVHPESRARLQAFHSWKPHVLTDHHEMGSSSTFFFQPGVPERVNPLTPEGNVRLTTEISKYHARALDQIGSLYFSEEGFDDFYYGKGSTYPDVNASIGILFEQSRVMGQKIENPHGELSFAEAIRNHFTVSISTIRASMDKREALHEYQNSFFKEAYQLADNHPVKGYVFKSPKDPVKAYYFIRLLQNHDINLYSLKDNMVENGIEFPKEESFVVPASQSQYRLIKSLFEKQTKFEDSIFYDVSTWTMPLAYDITYESIDSESRLKKYTGRKLDKAVMPQGIVTGGKSSIGYITTGKNYNIHAFIYHLQQKGIRAKVAAKEFVTDINNESCRLGPGSIFIPARQESMRVENLYQELVQITNEYGIELFSLNTGLSEEGIDLGSWNFVPIRKPKILLVAGDGVSSRSAGEIWHLLDVRMKMPVVMIKPDRINRLQLFDYNVLILPDGRYSWDEAFKKKLDLWIKEGGVVIALEDANRFLQKENWINWALKDKVEGSKNKQVAYADRRDQARIESVSGVILQADLDPTHPLNYGIGGNTIPVFKNNNLFVKLPDNDYNAPVKLGEMPLLSGFLSVSNKKNVSNSAWTLVNKRGRGAIISFTDNPNFRGYWLGTNKLFLNAIYYGNMIR